MLKEKLQIILITYNRAKYLRPSLESIFSADSPVKDFDITIVDNNSTDETAQIVKEFKANFPNLKYKKNRYNIGGNANIARAFELPEKEYFWILCDDDSYDWSCWGEVEKAVAENRDLIVVSNYELRKGVVWGTLVNQLTFVPAAIYKTANVTNDVIQNAGFNIPFLFPHLSLICSLINNGKIENRAIVSKGIVNKDNFFGAYTRGLTSTSNSIKNTLWITGFINSIQLIEDPKIRTKILDTLIIRPFKFFSVISAEFKRNRLYGGNSFRNICEVFCGISFGQKIQFLLALVWLDIVYFIKKFILRNPKYMGKKA